MAMSDSLTIGNDNNALAESRRAVARVWFESLRDRICAEVEALEREAPAELFPGTPATFVYKPWTRTTGSGGGTGGFLSEGRLFEKIGIHTSSANGKLTPEMAKTLPGDGVQLDYVSTSISLIMQFFPAARGSDPGFVTASRRLAAKIIRPRRRPRGLRLNCCIAPRSYMTICRVSTLLRHVAVVHRFTRLSANRWRFSRAMR